jgi:hypothetical protein
MIQKSGKWMADCFDTQGKRRRKAFKTKNVALTFQTHQRQAAATAKRRPTQRKWSLWGAQKVWPI